MRRSRSSSSPATRGPLFADPVEGWSDAPAYAGKPAEAKAHFAPAARLDLTDADKAEIARHL